MSRNRYRTFFKKSKEICKNYEITHIRIDDLVFKKNDINLTKILKANIFIYQPLDEKHGDISTKKIIKMLNPSCIKISFPYIYNNSFYPVKGPLLIKDSHKKKQCSIIYDNSEVITDLIDKNYSLEEIITLYKNNKINFNYEDRFNYTNSILQQKESECDIKILNFIKDNFNKERLFLLENHPTSIIFINVVNQILEKISLSKLPLFNCDINEANLPGGLLPIDKSSNNFFNYEFDIDDNSYDYYNVIITNIYNFYAKKNI